MMDHLILFIALSLLAEIIGTVGGFGSSLLFVPIAGFFVDFHSVLGITAIFHLSSNISKITLFRKGIDKELIIRLGIPSIIFVALGAYFTKYADTRLLEIILAIFLILVSIGLYVFKNLKIKPNLSASIIGGSLSGFAAGLLGTGGAIRGLTLSAFNLTKDVFIATSAIIDLGIDLTRTIIYWINGYVHRDDLYTILSLVIVGFIGTYIGKRILNYFSEQNFKTIVLGLVLIIGIITLFKQLN
jgi:uncharacterized protein